MKMKLGLLAAVLLLVSSLAAGQAVYGSIVGTVTDATGAAVPRAKVTVVDTGRGVTYTTATNESGNFSQTHLIAGVYEVRIEASGMKTFVQPNVNVSIDQVSTVNAQLEVGSVAEVINITAETPLLKTEKAEVADILGQKTVTEVPILGRDVNKLYFLVPGIQVTGTTAASEQPHALYRPTIGGQYWGGIAFQLDGTDNRESVLGEPVISPNLDSLAELKITTTAYDAEFGQASQAVISAHTKSGTNELHGTGFWFRRDQVGQARDPFTQNQPIPALGNRFIPPTLWNQFGGSAGGPIQKDKTFIFGDYQGTRERVGGSLTTRVPTQAERNGDLSALATSQGVNIYNACLGTDCNIAPASRQAFTGNVIPSALLSPQAQALLKFIPLPNIAATNPGSPNFAASGIGVQHWNAFDVRVDRYQTEKMHMFGRYSFLQVSQTKPGAFGFLAGGPQFANLAFAGQASLRNQSLSYALNYAIRPNWLADFRFGFFRYRVFVDPNGLGTSPAKDAGIPGINLDNYYTSGMPAFTINGAGGFQFGYSLGINSCNCPLNQQENEYQWVGNSTRIFGNHSVKFGVDWRHHRNLRVPSDVHRSGQLTFDAATTQGPTGGGLGLASFLLGHVRDFGRYVSNSTDAAERQNRFFSYVQDTWRVTRQLTVNYGLRWEIYFPQYVNGRARGGFQNLATGEVLIAGENGIGLNGDVNTALTHFAPRLGITYQVTPKTVVRTGFGRSYDVGVFGFSFGHNVTQNLPVLANQSLNPTQPWLAVFTLAQGPPAVLDPSTILASQPKGPTGNPLLPNGIAPRVLPLTHDNKMRLPTVDAWNFTIEHQFTPSTIVSLAYVGNHGSHMTAGGTNYNINQPSIVGFGTVPTNQRRLFFQKFGWTQNINYYAGDASVKFNSLQLRGEKRFSNGMTVQSNFTWGSSFDFENNYFFWNHDLMYGRQANFRRFVWNLNQMYELPFGRNRKWLKNISRPADLVLGGWQLSSIWLWESGYPFTPGYSNCSADMDTGPCRSNLISDASVPNPSRDGWFKVAPPGSLATPGATSGPWGRPQRGTFGNVARNSFFGPRFLNADLSLGKSFAITERFRAQFRAELFNAFNKVNLGQPNATVDSSTAGKIFALQTLAQMRRWQFGLRVSY